MKVLLVGNYADDAQHSMLGFGRVMMGGLPVHGVAPTFTAPVRKLWRPRGKLDKWGAYVDKYLLFPRQLRRQARGVDLVHLLDQGNGIYLGHLRDKPNVVTVHDLLAIKSALGELPSWQTGKRGRVYQAAILRGLKQARCAACSSHATSHDVKRLVGLPEANCRVVLLAAFGTWSSQLGVQTPERIKQSALTGGTYAMQVGGSLPYKNCAGAVELFDALRMASSGPLKLVIVARELSDAITTQIAELGLADKVVRLSGLSGPDLEWLYSNAWGLLMTSYDEGFGLPILEAQGCGCPVYTTNKEPMTEVGGEGAVYIDLLNIPTSATKIIESRPALEAQRNRGYENLKRFSLEGTVSRYAALYRELA